jgi:RNA polymerase sporulation-specific sigma factor
LIGSPAEVQKELDDLAIKLQKRPKNQETFIRIVSYMHKYILGLVFKKYSFIRGYEVYDIYQEALIALFKKAVPSFRRGKGMSFLNFAKMCINRHLITILHASRTRRKDLPMNTAISLDHNPAGHPDDDDSCPLSNVIAINDSHEAPYEDICRTEAFMETLGSLRNKLSQFECIVLEEYLESKSYRLAARAIRKKYGEPCNEKSIDNALLRIRKKAEELKNEDDLGNLPLLR